MNTNEKNQIIIDALRDRIGKLYDMQEAYAKGGNKEAAMDCANENRRVKEVLEEYIKNSIRNETAYKKDFLYIHEQLACTRKEICGEIQVG